MYDMVSNLSWAVDIRTHTIKTVINNILSDPWPPAIDIGRDVPLRRFEDDCMVRKFIERPSYPSHSDIFQETGMF